MRKYRRLTTIHVVIISKTPAEEPIRTIAAYSPAEATMPMDIRPACSAFIPTPRAVMPSAKDTAKYPIQMGTAVEDREYFESTTVKIVRTRERFKEDLRKMGFSFPDSKANFVFASHPDFSGDYLFTELRKKNIVVRHWNSPAIKEYLRITIGTDEQMDAVISALQNTAGLLRRCVGSVLGTVRTGRHGSHARPVRM